MNTNQFGYDAHLERLRGRPGEGLQNWLVSRYMRLIEANLGEKSSPILEIGPGVEPFPLSTHFVDFQHTEQYKDKNFWQLDVNINPLPFKDKEFDFVVCRHTLEDLYNPSSICNDL